ncbi:MAG: hypothetical protein ACFE9C_14580 [Candidatus Hodarchaeota archaeon]
MKEIEVELKDKSKKYCQFCGSEIKPPSEDKTSGFSQAYFEEEERLNKLCKIYSEFKYFIENDDELKEIMNEVRSK